MGKAVDFARRLTEDLRKTTSYALLIKDYYEEIPLVWFIYLFELASESTAIFLGVKVILLTGSLHECIKMQLIIALDYCNISNDVRGNLLILYLCYGTGYFRCHPLFSFSDRQLSVANSGICLWCDIAVVFHVFSADWSIIHNTIHIQLDYQDYHCVGVLVFKELHLGNCIFSAPALCFWSLFEHLRVRHMLQLQWWLF